MNETQDEAEAETLQIQDKDHVTILIGKGLIFFTNRLAPSNRLLSFGEEYNDDGNYQRIFPS